MLLRKLLLITLLTLSSGLALMAQNIVNVHGAVTNDQGDPQDSVNILVSAFFADSSAFFQSVFTDPYGSYTVDIPSPGQNFFGIVDVSMIDCFGSVQSQQFFILTGNEVFEADFVYCEEFMVDSCVVFVIEEWNPNGVIQLTAWTPPGLNPTYEWTTGETTQTIFPQQSGTYCVTATFPWGCSVADCIDVNNDSTEFCYGFIIATPDNAGTYDLEAIAIGVAPFTYAWTTGDTTQALYGVGPGTYCVEITDSTGCAFTTCTIVDDFNFCEVYISEDPTGGLTTYGFGEPPVTYVWSTGDTTQTIYPSGPDLYCVSATDANGCEATSCYQYGWFPDSCWVFVNAYVQDSNVVVLEAVGYSGAQSWSYLWSTGDTTPIIYPQDLSQSYCVTLTDSEGCTSTDCFESGYWCYAWVDVQYVDTTTAVLTAWTDPIFGVPGSLTPTYLWSDSSTAQTLTVTASGEYCVTVTIGNNCQTVACGYVDFENLGNECSVFVIQYQDTTGQWLAEAWAWGWGTFSYNWTNGDTNSVTQIAGPNEPICVTVTSSLGCQSYACLDTFFNPCEARIDVLYLNNQSATLTATLWSDPSQGAQYLWSTGESGPSITVTSEGTYCVTVYAGGCTSETCVEVYFWNADSCGVWISSEFDPLGTLYTANAWGVPPYTYAWSNGWTEASQVIDFGIHDLCVTVTDANGCASEACNFQVDSCFVILTYGQGYILASANEPIADIYWSTGDTLPFISVSVPGQYCATVTTLLGCTSTTCITIDTLNPGGGFNIINGYVRLDSLMDPQGRVDAYLVDQNTGNAFVLAGTSPIGDDGYYAIQGLPQGVYLIRAELTPGTVGADDFMPTYHLSSATWENADPYVLPNWLPVTTDIRMIRTTVMNGGGVIGGLITDPNHILAEDHGDTRGGGGLPGVVVLLRDQQGQPLDYVITLDDGSFKFDGLPWGTYRISYDIPGLISPDVWVTLTPEDPERLQITLVVNEGTVAVEEPESVMINLYPNPANYEIHIPVPGRSNTYEIQLVDMQGKVVYAGSERNLNGVLTVGVGTFSPGIYLVQVQGDGRLYHGRFIKQD